MQVPYASRLPLTVLATALGTASPLAAYAQEVASPGTPSAAAGQVVPTPARPPEEAAKADPVDTGEIVVTATRREQRIQDVPIAISAIGAEAIQERQVTQVSDIIKLSPNSQVSYPYGEGGPPNFVIRGISSTDYSPNQSKPIAIYVDEGIRNLQAFESMPVFDVERVEVLRGPGATGRRRPVHAGGGTVRARRWSLPESRAGGR